MPHPPADTPPGRRNTPPGTDAPRAGGRVRAAGPPAVTPEAVADYLRQHPDFLTDFLARNPGLTALLAPPVRDFGAGVVDLGSFIVGRMRAELAQVKLSQRRLIATSRNNLASQTRVHGAVLALLAATSLSRLLNVITEELPLLLDVDAIGLCVERPRHVIGRIPTPSPAILILEAGEIDRLIGPGRNACLRADVTGSPELFGPAVAGLVRSDALVRLQLGDAAPASLLALGARRPNVFHPGQGTDLLNFLAQVISISLRNQLDTPGN